LAEEYQVSADTISDIAAEGLTRDSQQAQVTPTEGDQTPAGQPSDEDMLGGASLNGAQVASLINVINAVAMGAVSKEGAVSIITAAFPTISPDQARAIIAGVNIGTTIPTTKEEKQQITKDQGGDASGGSTPPAPEPTTPSPAPGGTSQKKSSLEILESLDPASIKMLIEGMMGGIELAKYDGIDFTPPQGARDAAKRALDVREGKPSSQRGMTPVGIARARDLINGVKMSPDTVRRMKAFFDRHEVDKKGATWDEQGKGWQAWNGWGGDAGYAWARKVVGQMEARDKKTEFVAGRDCGQDEGGTFGPDNKCAVGYGRPPLKGGYTPTRPGGKFPKDYKRPTEQGKGKPKPPAPTGRPLPPKPLPPKGIKPKKQTEGQKEISRIEQKFMKENILTVLPTNSRRAQEIEESFDRLKKMGYSIPPPDQILTTDLAETYKDASYSNAYAVATTSQTGKIQMIFNSKLYNRPDDQLVMTSAGDVRSKWTSSADTFAHEYAHNVHIKSIGLEETRRLKTELFGKEQEGATNKEIAGEVSRYAQTNPLEFVAETFAGHIGGKKYSKNVYNLYKKFGGPELK
jgi:hypothetical protein